MAVQIEGHEKSFSWSWTTADLLLVHWHFEAVQIEGHEKLVHWALQGALAAGAQAAPALAFDTSSARAGAVGTSSWSVLSRRDRIFQCSCNSHRSILANLSGPAPATPSPASATPAFSAGVLGFAAGALAAGAGAAGAEAFGTSSE